jgi:hypothetical protein
MSTNEEILDEQDTEGHKNKYKAARELGPDEPGDEQDTEGHKNKYKAAKESSPDEPGDEQDTQGHGLLLDTDYYINRKMGRDAEVEREMRERRREKEARPNKQER